MVNYFIALDPPPDSDDDDDDATTTASTATAVPSPPSRTWAIKTDFRSV